MTFDESAPSIMAKRSLLILTSFLLKEACGRLQNLLGVVFVRMDIGWGSNALKLEASSGPERHCEENIGVIVSLERILKLADSVFCISPKFWRCKRRMREKEVETVQKKGTNGDWSPRFRLSLRHWGLTGFD